MKTLKIKITTLVLVLFSTVTFAGNLANITGKIVNEESLKPIPNALVILYNADNSEIISISHADMDGNFVLEVDQTKNYYLQVQSMGYENSEIEKIDLMQNERFYDTGIICVNSTDIQLEEIVIIGKKS